MQSLLPVTDFNSPAIFLNNPPYLKEIIITFVFKVEKPDSQKLIFFQSVNHTESPPEIPLKET